VRHRLCVREYNIRDVEGSVAPSLIDWRARRVGSEADVGTQRNKP
jgi:hypothetical protein